MAISEEIIQFANGNTDFYEAFADYHNHKAAEEWNSKMGAYDHNVSLSVKSGKVRDAFFAEVERLSGCKMTAENKDAWMANQLLLLLTRLLTLFFPVMFRLLLLPLLISVLLAMLML